MGYSKLLKRNELQCFHTPYNLSQKYKADKWASIRTLVTMGLSENIQHSVTAGWECVGKCVST